MAVTSGIVGIPIGGTLGGFIAAQVAPENWSQLYIMGGAIPIGAGRSFSFGRRSLMTTERDVKWSVSYATAATPSWVTGIHAPP